MEYNIRKGQLHTDLDCPYDEDGNKIDVYSSVSWTADTKERYEEKEAYINEFSYEDDLIKANAWCDVSGFEYWVIKQEENNYVSIDVCLKKNPDDYTQDEIGKISQLIQMWNEQFWNELENEID